MGMFDIMEDMMRADYLAERIAQETRNAQLLASIPMTRTSKVTFDGGKIHMWDKLFKTNRYRKQMRFERCMRICKEADDDYHTMAIFTTSKNRTNDVVEHMSVLSSIQDIQDIYDKSDAYIECRKKYKTFTEHIGMERMPTLKRSILD